MENKVRSGGCYCKVCKKCLSQPRVRKNYQAESWIICEECGPNVLRITFVPREEAVKTDFHISFEDIPRLIEMLKEAYHKRPRI